MHSLDIKAWKQEMKEEMCIASARVCLNMTWRELVERRLDLSIRLDWFVLARTPSEAVSQE